MYLCDALGCVEQSWIFYSVLECEVGTYVLCSVVLLCSILNSVYISRVSEFLKKVCRKSKYLFREEGSKEKDLEPL